MREREDPLIEWRSFVVDKVPGLVDHELPARSAVAVLAMAYELVQNGEDALASIRQQARRVVR
jgi:hypothetical protein